jgi:hypothetical protein
MRKIIHWCTSVSSVALFNENVQNAKTLQKCSGLSSAVVVAGCHLGCHLNLLSSGVMWVIICSCCRLMPFGLSSAVVVA